MMAAIPFVLPYGMQWAWQTKPLHDDRLGNLMRAIGYARLPLRLWPTDSRLATAVVVGVIPGARHLVITDGLRELLSHRQMTMVILHELAHLRRGHMFFRLAAVLPVWVVVGVCHWLWPNEPMAATVGMVGGGVTALVMLRLLSHATEFDADQTACRFAVQLAGSGIPDVPSSLADAARELTSALHALTAGDIRAQRATWLHPSLAQRFFRLHGLAGTSVTT